MLALPETKLTDTTFTKNCPHLDWTKQWGRGGETSTDAYFVICLYSLVPFVPLWETSIVFASHRQNQQHTLANGKRGHSGVWPRPAHTRHTKKEGEKKRHTRQFHSEPVFLFFIFSDVVPSQTVQLQTLTVYPRGHALKGLQI